MQPLRTFNRRNKNSKTFSQRRRHFILGLKLEQAYGIKKTPNISFAMLTKVTLGTFKDRDLLAKDPLQLIEGMIISAFSFGANQGLYIYSQ